MRHGLVRTSMPRSARPSGKPPLHVPDRGAHIRKGLSHMVDVPTTPEEVTCSPPIGNRLFAARAVVPHTPQGVWGLQV